MDLFKIGLLQNQYLFAHIIGGGLFGIIFWRLFKRHDRVLLLVLTLAIAWEIGEYLWGNIAVYGDIKRFLMDGFFDIIGALFGAIIAIFNVKEERL